MIRSAVFCIALWAGLPWARVFFTADGLPTDTTAQGPRVLQRAVQGASQQTGVDLLLGGGEGGPWFHAGVLQAVAQYRVPISQLRATSWGSLVASLWQHGFEGAQIQTLLKNDSLVRSLWEQSEHLPGAVSHSLVPRHGDWLEEGEIPSYGVQWVLFNARVGAFALEPRNLALEEAELAVNHLRLRLEAWQSRYARRQDRQWSYPEHVVETGRTLWKPATAVDAWFCGLPLTGLAGRCPGQLSDEVAHAFPLAETMASSGERAVVVASSWPLRTQNQNSPAQLRFSVDLAAAQPAIQEGQAIVVRPHRVPVDSQWDPDFWYRQGFDAVRASLGRVWRVVEKPVPSTVTNQALPVDLKVAVVRMDDIPSQYHNHLESFAHEAGLQTIADSARMDAFATHLQTSGIYDSVQLSYQQESGELLVRARPRSLLTVWGGGLGDAAVAPTAAAGLRMRFVSQLEYDMRLQVLGGGPYWGILPAVYLSRIQGSRFGLGYEGEILRMNGRGYIAGLGLSPWNRLLEAEIWRQSLLFSWRTAPNQGVVSRVTLDKSGFRTGLSEFLATSENINFPRDQIESNLLSWDVSYADSTRNHRRWFDLDGGARRLQAGVRAVAITGLGKSSAPLYTRLRYDEERALPLTRWLSVGGALGSGVDFKTARPGLGGYPDSLEIVPEQWTDPALGDYFRQQIAPTPWGARWVLSEYASHGWMMGRVSAALHHRGVLGVWGFTGVLQDLEEQGGLRGDPLLFTEVVARLRWRSWEVRAGAHGRASAQYSGDLWDPELYHFYFQVGSLNLLR